MPVTVPSFDFGHGAPTAVAPPNGSAYFDLDTRNCYRKTGGLWVLKGSMAAAVGTQFLYGSGVPVITSTDGDVYIDTATDNLYKYAMGSWGLVVNLKGAQ